MRSLRQAELYHWPPPIMNLLKGLFMGFWKAVPFEESVLLGLPQYNFPERKKTIFNRVSVTDIWMLWSLRPHTPCPCKWSFLTLLSTPKNMQKYKFATCMGNWFLMKERSTDQNFPTRRSIVPARDAIWTHSIPRIFPVHHQLYSFWKDK